MAETSTAYTASEKERRAQEGNYSLYAASQDSTLQAILTVLQKMLGGDSPMLREMGLLANAFSGLGNSGVSSHAQIATAIRRHGVLGTTSGGLTGTIGGADLVSGAAASALHASMMNTFRDPLTKATTGAARGLSQAELGKAVALAIQNGSGMSSAVFGQDKSGNITVGKGLDAARALKSMETEVGEAASFLKSIKGFLGSNALRDLDGTLRDVFGGVDGVRAFGGSRGARMRLETMANLSRLHNPDDPLKMFGFMNGIGNMVARGFGGPGMNPEEAKYRFKAAGAAVQPYIAMGAMAANRHYQGAEAGVSAGRFLGGPMFEDRALAQGQLVSGLARQEEERMVAQYVARDQGGESMREFRILAKRLEQSGGDPNKVASARAALSEFVSRRSGMTVNNHDKVAIQRMPGVQVAEAQLSYDQMRTWGAERVQDSLRDYATQFGVTGEQATTAGFGYANLDSGQQAHLRGLLKKGNKREISDYIDKELRGNLEAAGVNVNQFASQMYGATNQAGIDKLVRMGRHAAAIPHFVSAGALRQEQDSALAQQILGLTGADSSPDVMRDLVSGIMGQREFSDSQVLRSMQGGDVGLDTAADGTLSPTDENRARIRALTGEDFDLNTRDGRAAAQKLLRSKYGGTPGTVEKVNFTGEGMEGFSLASKGGRISDTAANREQIARVIGKSVSSVDLSTAEGMAAAAKALSGAGYTGAEVYTQNQLLISTSGASRGGVHSLKTDEQGNLLDSDENRKILSKLTDGGSFDLSTSEGRSAALSRLGAMGVLSREGNQFLFASTEDSDEARKTMNIGAQRSYLEQVSAVTGNAIGTWAGGSQEQLDQRVKDMSGGKGALDGAKAFLEDTLKGVGATDSSVASRAEASMEVLGKVGASMDEAHRELMMEAVQKQIKDEEKKLKDIRADENSYKDGKVTGSSADLVGGAEDKYAAGIKRKQALEKLYKGLGGKDANTHNDSKYYNATFYSPKINFGDSTSDD